MSYERAQEILQNALINTYFSNLKFLRECDENLFGRVESLSLAIDSNEYEPRYELEFLEDVGDFDIYDRINDCYLYSKNSFKTNNRYALNTNLDNKGSFSSFVNTIYAVNNELSDEFSKIKNIQEGEESIYKCIYSINNYKKILKDTTFERKEFKRLDKFFFIGTLLSRHIPKIVDKIKAKEYFIHEPNLEIFRLSLFVFEYSILLSNNANVTFSIMDDDTILEEKSYQFLLKKPWTNHTIKFCTSDYNIDKSFDTILNAMTRYNPTSYNYNMLLYNVFRSSTEKFGKYKILTFPLKEEANVFNNKPILYVCAGPSLNNSLEWIKKNQDKFYIVTIGSAYKKLLEKDIIVDIIITLDSSYKLTQSQFDDESTKKIQNTIVLASTLTDKRVLDRFNQDKLFLFETSMSLKSTSNLLKGYSVGEIGYRLLLEVKASEIYLIGTDLAINQDDGSTHALGASTKDIKQHNIQKRVSNIEKATINDKEDIVEVKGNLRNTVKTTRLFNCSISAYNKISKELLTTQKVYNLCEHGAFLENIIPLPINEININTIGNINKDLFSNFLELERLTLDDSDVKVLKDNLLKIDEMIKYLNDKKKIQYNNYDELKYIMIDFYKKYISYEKQKSKNFFLKIILNNYYAVINTYIEYALLDKKLKKEKQKVSKVSTLWFDELLELICDYKDYLKKIT